MVTTRSQKRQVVDSAAVMAIARGGDHALRRLLGVKGGKIVSRRGGRPEAAKRGCSAQHAEIARLRGIVDQLKAGRRVTAARAARPAANFRNVDLFQKTPFLIAGSPYQAPEISWKQAQVSNADNRARARNPFRKPFRR